MIDHEKMDGLRCRFREGTSVVCTNYEVDVSGVVVTIEDQGGEVWAVFDDHDQNVPDDLRGWGGVGSKDMYGFSCDCWPSNSNVPGEFYVQRSDLTMPWWREILAACLEQIPQEG